MDSQLPILVHRSVLSPIRRKLQRQTHKLLRRRRMINETKNKHKDICYTLTLISLKSHFQFPYNNKKMSSWKNKKNTKKWNKKKKIINKTK
jgi:hypothetical protein